MVTDVGGQVWGHNFRKYILARVNVSLTALIFGNVTNLKALFPLWCRPIFPNWSVSKIEKTVFRQRTPRSTIWTPGTGYGRVDWNRSWYPSLLAGKRYSDTVFNIGSDLPVDQCDATFNSFLAHSILGDPGAVSRVDKMSTRLTASGSPRMSSWMT